MSVRLEQLEPRRLLAFSLTPIYSGTVIDSHALNGQLFFIGANVSSQFTEAFVNDGSRTGNRSLALVQAGEDFVPRAVDWQGKILFQMGKTRTDFQGNVEPALYITDGTIDGTAPAGARRFYYKDFLTTQTTKLGSFYYGLTSDPDNRAVQKFVRFRDSLTPLTLATFSNFNPSTAIDGLGKVMNAGNRLFFFSGDLAQTSEDRDITLWTSDGTKAGTHTVKSFERIYKGTSVFNWANNVYPQNRAGQNDFFFAADDGVNGMELWKSDGTAAGTVRLSDIGSGGENSFIVGLGFLNGKFLFEGFTDHTAPAIYATDGTSAPVKVVDTTFFSAPDSGGLAEAFVSNGKLFFENGQFGGELWVTDGTAGGTSKIGDAKTIRSFATFRGEVYFAAFDGGDHLHIYHSNGTANGTGIAVDLADNFDDGSASALTPVGNSLYFVAQDNVGNSQSLFRISDVRTAVSGVVFKDSNANGARDKGEKVRAGAHVYLDLNNNNTLDRTDLTTTTDSLGRYSFADVAPAKFRVHELLEAGRWQSGGFNEIDLRRGDKAYVDLGGTPGSVIAGKVFSETTSFGHFDRPSEPGVPGMSVFLDLNDDGKRAANEPITITDDIGRYSFAGLENKTYTVRLVRSPIWFNTTTTRRQGLAFSSQPLLLNFGVGIPPTLLGAVEDSDNATRYRTPLKIFLDDNNNAGFDAGEAITTTDALGRFRFTGSGVTAGNKSIVAVPGQEIHIDRRFLSTVILQPGETSNSDVSVTRMSQLGGYAFYDTNGDHKFTLFVDTALGSDVIAYLDANNNGQRDVGELTSGDPGDGGYLFPSVTAGAAQTIRLQTTRPILAPAAKRYSAAVAAGEIVDHLDFELQPPS